jgi:hypothetical protein
MAKAKKAKNTILLAISAPSGRKAYHFCYRATHTFEHSAEKSRSLTHAAQNLYPLVMPIVQASMPNPATEQEGNARVFLTVVAP